MTDDEILTKRLSDWKPETDIKLQKALGKFVEEVGELLESAHAFMSSYQTNSATSFENEIADSYAVMAMIEHASEGKINADEDLGLSISQISVAQYADDKPALMSTLMRDAGKSVSIVGRCLIQGLGGSDPETKKSNIEVLTKCLDHFRVTLWYVMGSLNFDKERIENRTRAKIASKLPWVMGTAIDLLPDIH